MEMEYVKELDRVYLVPGEVEIDEDEYILQMALRGRLPGRSRKKRSFSKGRTGAPC